MKIGQLFEESADFQKAKEFHERVISLNSDDIHTLLKLGQIEEAFG